MATKAKIGERKWQVIKRVWGKGPWKHNSYHHTRDEARDRKRSITKQGMPCKVIKKGSAFPEIKS